MFVLKLLRILVSMYSSIRSYVRLNDKVTQPFNCIVGTRQGHVSSTILFSLFINDKVTQPFNCIVVTRQGVSVAQYYSVCL